MAKEKSKASTTVAAPQPASQGKRKSTRTSASKGDANAVVDTSVDPQTLPQDPSSRPKRSGATKASRVSDTPTQPQPKPTSRKRQTLTDNQHTSNGINSAPEAGLELEGPPPAKKTRKKATNDSEVESIPAPAVSVKKASTKKLAKGTSSGQPAKENIPPKPVAKAGKATKSNAIDCCEQQLNAVDQAALELRIKELEGKNSIQAISSAIPIAKLYRILAALDFLAENASHLRKVKRLKRKTKRLDQHAAILTSSAADVKTDQLIEEPEATKYSLQIEMGLASDYKTYARIQRTVRDLARRTLNFNQSWKNQDAIVIGDLFRAEPFLRRFRQNWATGKLAQMYLRNARSYNTNIDLPESAVAVRRAKTTCKGAEEAGLPPPDLLQKRKSTPRALIPAGSKLGKSTKSAADKATSVSTTAMDLDLDADNDESNDDKSNDDSGEEERQAMGGHDGEEVEEEGEEGMEGSNNAEQGAPSSDGCSDGHPGQLSAGAFDAAPYYEQVQQGLQQQLTVQTLVEDIWQNHISNIAAANIAFILAKHIPALRHHRPFVNYLISERFAIHCLCLRKSRYYPMSTSGLDEATTAGNIKILFDLVVTQMKLAPSRLHHCLILVCGDLMTVNRLQTVKMYTKANLSEYDKYSWVLPMAQLWHLKWAFLKGIVKCHWAPQSGKQIFRLRRDAEALGRSINPKQCDFYSTHRLVEVVYESMVLHCARLLIQELLPPSTPSPDSNLQLLEELSAHFSLRGNFNSEKFSDDDLLSLATQLARQFTSNAALEEAEGIGSRSSLIHGSGALLGD